MELSFTTYHLQNARDLGGTPLADGREVMPGLLLRSCMLALATDDEIRALQEHYRPRFIIDLRTGDEAEKHPDPMRLLPGAKHFGISLATDDEVGVVRKDDLRDALKMAEQLKHDPVGMMTSMYRDIVMSGRGREGLAEVFDILLEAGGSCVLWHCTAGKDRAGVTAALILSALGASREAVYHDYLLTNFYMEPYLRSQERRMRLLPKGLKQRMAVVNRADPRFLDAAFDAIEAEYGSVGCYLRQALGLTDEKLRALRELYTREA